MIKRKPILVLLILYLLNLVFCVNVNTATTQNYIPRKVDFDRSGVPKNILLGSYVGGRSHVKPMLDIAAILIERGYNVTLLTSGRYEPSSEYPGLKQVSLGPQWLLKGLKNLNIHRDFDYRALTKLSESSINDYKVTYEKYKNVAKEYNIDLFFCDVLINEACIDIAHNLKKPVVALTSLVHFIDPVPYKSDPLYGCDVSLENKSFFERFRCTIIQPLQIAYELGPLGRQLNNIRKQMNIKTVSGKVPKVSLALIDTYFGFELPQPLPPNVQEIGPVLPEEYPPLTPELSDFINSHKRVLYVAFGTRFYASTENNNKILQSLVEAVNKKLVDGVIWALSQTSKEEFYPTLDLTDGTQMQTLPLLNNKHPHIRIAKFAPQFAVLNHTNTKLFFSHGGAGSTHESLYTGTPMLVLPFGGDQMGNAQKLRSAGVALTLDKLSLGVNDILNKMSILLKDEKIKKNLKRLEVLTKINSKRKYRAADLIEYILHSSGLEEYVNDDFLKEWAPAGPRMGFIKANNLDVYGVMLGIVLVLIGGITFKLFSYTSSPSPIKLKSKKA
ncbi:hypothetical protein RclHR1_10150001 [Rhizophagus clarus]|uniref:Glycosyltransferase family 1 protein n=1 Tax=Rhizophagus clarus TaxID=94130 RepID=A0A2Z6QEY4_9GLOM|nr:hypothetical protein RclHR1_10150001 [Rhizophagus clarus]GES80929.1 glycosyltransferase family 1 protein [Rhizophagus clarus]